MPRQGRQPTPRYRLRIVAGGLIVAGALFSFGAPWYVNRIEADLARRVPEAVAEAGFGGVSAEFDGQDGTLRCSQPLTDPTAATRAAYDVWGVRAITLDRSCRVNQDGAERTESATLADGGSSASGSAGESTTSVGTFATIADVIEADPQFSYLSVLVSESASTDFGNAAADPVTLFAPTDAAFEALSADVNAQLRSDPALLTRVLGRHVTRGVINAAALAGGPIDMVDGSTVDAVREGPQITVGGGELGSAIVAGNGVVFPIDVVFLPDGVESSSNDSVGVVDVVFDGAMVMLGGTVVSEVERARLVNTATVAAGEGKVVDSLLVDPDTGLDGSGSEALAELLVATVVNLVNGSVGYDGSAFYVRGVYATDEGRDAVQAVADAYGIVPELVQQPSATAAEAAALEIAVNAVVAEQPIPFNRGQATMTSDAATLLDEIAAQLVAVPGITVEVEGHTDSDVVEIGNQVLSEQRADAVRMALIERGVPAATITAVGFGSTQPVLVNGVEDKDASRRVEFRIGVAR